MAVFARYLAPAGAPISVADLGGWARSALTGPGHTKALTDALRLRFGDRRYFHTSTGRAGMTLLLRAMRRLAPSERDEVVLPSYTCYSVAASAAKAGLKVRLVDVDPTTLDFEYDELASTDFRRVLAIVATSLYGFPNEMPALTRLAQEHGVYLIDDAAQSMGASVEGRLSGLWGDAGLFSFDKGKNVCAIDGGVLHTESADLADALDAETSALGRPSIATSGIHVAKALAYAVLLRPAVYGLATRIPALGLGQTVYTTDYPVAATDPLLALLASTMLPHLDGFSAARRANAEALLARIRVLPGLQTIRPSRHATPAYLRLPVLMTTEAARETTLATLIRAGIGATRSYPASLADVPELRPTLAPTGRPLHGGRHVARTIMTLPTHPFVTTTDVERMGDLLQAVVAPRLPATSASVGAS